MFGGVQVSAGAFRSQKRKLAPPELGLQAVKSGTTRVLGTVLWFSRKAASSLDYRATFLAPYTTFPFNFCIFACVWVVICVWGCMWRTEVVVWCLPQLLSVFSEVGPLVGPGAHQWGSAASQLAWGNLLSPLPDLELQVGVSQAFMWVLVVFILGASPSESSP